VEVSQCITIDTGSEWLPGILLEIGSWSLVSGFRGCIQLGEVQWRVRGRMVNLDGVRPGSPVASASGFIRSAHL